MVNLIKKNSSPSEVQNLHPSEVQNLSPSEVQNISSGIWNQLPIHPNPRSHRTRITFMWLTCPTFWPWINSTLCKPRGLCIALYYRYFRRRHSWWVLIISLNRLWYLLFVFYGIVWIWPLLVHRYFNFICFVPSW